MAKRYSEVEIERGMIAAATLGIRPAAEKLGIPQATLHAWTRDQPERYAEIREQEAPKWRARAAAGFEDVVDTLTDLERIAADKLSLDLHTLDAKDVAGALKNITVSKGINAQHVHNLRDRPSQVIEHRVSMPAIEKGLEALGVLSAVETTAVEVETSELIEVETG